MEKNKKVSTTEPTTEEVKGAAYQIFFLNLSKIFISNNCADKKATPEATAILFDIKLEKSVEKYNVNITPKIKPM